MNNNKEKMDAIIEELETASEAIHKYKESGNITSLNKAYEAVNNSRQTIGSELKSLKASLDNK